jgi:hypothetical protein
LLATPRRALQDALDRLHKMLASTDQDMHAKVSGLKNILAFM